MSYPQGPQQPSGNGGNNNGNGSWPPNPFNRDGGNRGGNDPKPVWRSPWLWGVAIVVLAILMFQLFAGTGRQTIDTKDGMQLLDNGGVTYANIIDNRQLVQLDLSQDFTKQDPDTGRERNYGKEVQFYYTFAQGGDVIDSVEKANPSKGWTSSMQQTSVWSYLISSILPFIIIFGIFWFAMSRMGGAGGMFGMGGKKNNGKLLEGQTPKTKFADVAGEDAAVQEVEEIKDFLKDPSKYKALGARIPRGVLLYGPPGTGKTPSPARRACRSTRWPARTSSRCSWVSAPPACATCSTRRRRTPPPSSSSTRSTPSDAAVAPAWAAAMTNASRP